MQKLNRQTSKQTNKPSHAKTLSALEGPGGRARGGEGAHLEDAVASGCRPAIGGCAGGGSPGNAPPGRPPPSTRWKFPLLEKRRGKEGGPLGPPFPRTCPIPGRSGQRKRRVSASPGVSETCQCASWRRDPRRGALVETRAQPGSQPPGAQVRRAALPNLLMVPNYYYYFPKDHTLGGSLQANDGTG